MTERISVIGLGEFKILLRRHLKRKGTAYKRALAKAARTGVHIVRGHAPKAFGELRDSVHYSAGGKVDVFDLDTGEIGTATHSPSIIVDAPHAAAVEQGSRPHWVSLDALIKWCKLRNMQGKRPSRLKDPVKQGSSTLRQALSVRSQVKTAKREKGLTEDEAIVEVARAIQWKILQGGTDPHRFVQKSLPDLGDSLLYFLNQANDTAVGV